MKKIIVFVLMLVGFVNATNAQTTPTTPTDSTVNQLLGKYKFAEGSPVPEVTVAMENGALVMNSAAGSSPLEKSGEDVYIITQFQGTAKFTRNEDKIVTGVTILAMGYELVGTKEPVSTILFSFRKVVKPAQSVK